MTARSLSGRRHAPRTLGRSLTRLLAAPRIPARAAGGPFARGRAPRTLRPTPSTVRCRLLQGSCPPARRSLPPQAPRALPSLNAPLGATRLRNSGSWTFPRRSMRATSQPPLRRSCPGRDSATLPPPPAPPTSSAMPPRPEPRRVGKNHASKPGISARLPRIRSADAGSGRRAAGRQARGVAPVPPRKGGAREAPGVVRRWRGAAGPAAAERHAPLVRRPRKRVPREQSPRDSVGKGGRRETPSGARKERRKKWRREKQRKRTRRTAA